MILNPGQVVAGRYEIIEKIGSGGMSIVYRAKDIKLVRFVTFKVLREEYITDEEFTSRFEVEARAIACLNHPNIVNVYDVGREGPINYIVMEYIDGVTLKELIDENAPFSNVETLGVSLQIATALSHAHANDIVHRDIKPQNILVTSSGTVKVTDFGIARSMQSVEPRKSSEDDSTMGSVHYISPEQARNDAVDVRSDLYSLGILMYEMMTSELPFDAETAEDIACMHINDRLPVLHEKNPEILESVENIIYKLTSKKPLRRYQSAEQLCEDLRIAIADPDSNLGYESDNEPSPYKKVGGNKANSKKNYSEYDDEYEYKNDDGKKKEKLVILAAVATSLVIIALIVMWILPKFTPEQVVLVDVPDFVGLNVEDAKKTALELGIDIEELKSVNDDEVPIDHITWQNYNVGGKVELNTKIGVIISLGTDKIEVPDLKNLELAAVYVKMEGIPFTITEKAYENSDTVARNMVISQDPNAGQMAVSGTNIDIVISKGAQVKKISVPYLIGLTEEEAKAKLESKGLQVSAINRAQSAKYAKGIVTEQTKPGGSEVDEGASIGLMVSSGLIAASAEPTQTAKPSPTPSVTTDGTASSPKPTNTLIPTATQTPSANNGVTSKKTLYLSPTFPEGAESVELKLSKKSSDGSFTEVKTITVTPAQLPVSITVEGSGIVEYHMFVNGLENGYETVDFSKAAQ